LTAPEIARQFKSVQFFAAAQDQDRGDFAAVIARLRPGDPVFQRAHYLNSGILDHPLSRMVTGVSTDAD
jgi:hypothetical protein